MNFKPTKDSSFFSRVLFFTSFPLFFKSLLFSVDKSDFHHMRQQMQLTFLLERYNKTKTLKHRYKLIEMLKTKIILAALCAILSGIIAAYLSVLIKRLITYISGSSTNSAQAYTILFTWTILTVFKMFLLQNSIRLFWEIGNQCQMVTQAKVLQKIIDIPLHEKHAIVKSQVLGVFIMQIKRIHAFFKLAHFLFFSPTSFVLALALIFGQKGYLGFIVAHTLCAIMIILYFINQDMNQAKLQKQKFQRQRINTNIELVSQIKQLKNLGWQKLLYTRTQKLRQSENELNSQTGFLMEIYQLLLILIPILVFALMFMFDYLSGSSGEIQVMEVSQIYILINFVNMIHAPLKSLRTLFTSTFELNKAMSRIQAFLSMEGTRIHDNSDSSLEVGTLKIKSLITLQNQQSQFSRKQQKQKAKQSIQQIAASKKIHMSQQKFLIPELQINFNITVKPGQKLIILDSLNEGSTLLAYIAGYIKKYSGTLAYNGKLGYVPSKYWFSPQSIRDNIVFGHPFSRNSLQDAIYNADLDQQLKMYNDRQRTFIKEQIFSVSQLSRVAYARTLYTNPDIILLDDTFRTMNRGTIQSLNHRMKKKLAGKTFIIATDSIYCMEESDHILIFDGGKAVQYGTYIEMLQNHKSKIHDFVGNRDTIDTQRSIKQHKIIKQKQKQSHVIYLLRSRFRKAMFIKNLIKVIREKGVDHIYKMIDSFNQKKNTQKKFQSVSVGPDGPPSVKSTFKFYKKLFSYSPKILTLVTYFLIIIAESIMMFLNWFLGYMARPNQQQNERRNTAVFFIGSCIYVVIYYAQSYLDVTSTKQACNNIGSAMVNSIAKASPNTFQNIPLTVTTDKLNQDYHKIFILFSRFSHACRNSVLLIGTLVIISIESPQFLWYGIPLGILNIYFFMYLHRYQNQIADQHHHFSTPVLSSVQQVYDGIETYKFYGNPSQFIQKQLPNFYNFGVYRNQERQVFHLISFMAQISSMFLVWYLALHAIANKSILSVASITYIATSINYSIKVAYILSHINKQLIEAEVAIIKNVKKVFDYIGLKQQQNYDLPSKPKGWPRYPKIKINRLSVKRKQQSLHRSLKEISINIQAKQRVLIFGRGTSGIYSIFPVMMRELGAILNYDGTRGNIQVSGVDISHIGRKYILQEFFHLTPTPFVFSSTLRQNIDPFQQHSEHEIIKLLVKMNVQHFIVCQQKDLLQHRIILQQAPQGLRHIINVSRAILRNPSVILCELIQTNNGIEIQSLMSKEVPFSTMLFINPHLSFIQEADRIVFLSHGKVIENDTPVNIFENENSRFTKQLQNVEPMKLIELRKKISTMSISKISID